MEAQTRHGFGCKVIDGRGNTSRFAAGGARNGAMRARAPAWRPGARRAGVVLVAAALAMACDWDWNRTQPAPPRVDPAVGQAPATKTLPLATAPGADSDQRPSTDENMGRGFQGAIELSLRNAAGERRGLRYLARGNDARVQMDGLGGRGAFDALIWGEKMSVIDNEHRTYRTAELDDVQTERTAQDSRTGEVRTRKTGERVTLDGVVCEKFELEDGPLHVSTCVTGLPGAVSVDKFEAVSGIDVPAWVEQLISEDYFPLQASVRDAAGREIYALELTRYDAAPVDPSLVALPREYRAIEQGPSASSNRERPVTPRAR